MTHMSLIIQRIPDRIRPTSWARIVSDVLSPPIVWGAMLVVLGMAYTTSPAEALYWSALYSLFICLIPVAFIFLLVATGHIGDIHMKERHERHLPFLLTVICALIACFVLRSMNAPPIFRLLSTLTLVEITLLALITFFWQISMHAMCITCATVAIGIAVYLPIGFLLIPFILLVGAARLSLKRHTPAQVFWGATLGAIIPVVLLIGLPLHWLI